MAANATCNVCVSSFNKTTRREVTCAKCDFTACRTCNKTYILGTVNEPHCMNCKLPWDSEFISANFTKKFFNEDLADHRANALFESEKALMPATQERIRIMHLREEIDGLNNLAKVYDTIKKPEEARIYREKAYFIRRDNPELAEQAAPAAESRKNLARPVCGCIRDDCRGFVMNNNWKCGICNTKVCAECLKEDAGKTEHVCLDSDKETRKLLLKDTKPCPKCAVMIHKTEGCSQMWCVMCHTTFDWKTNEIVTGYVHNPHYFEWARRNGREIARAPGDVPPGEAPCGNELPHNIAFAEMVRRNYKSTAESDYLFRIYRVTAHIGEVTRDELRERDTAEIRDTIRMNYLLGNFTEKECKNQLIKTERRSEKMRAEWAVAELFLTHATDFVRNIYNTKPAKVMTLPIAKELLQLAEYCNTNFKVIAKAYAAPSWYCIELEIGRIFKMR